MPERFRELFNTIWNDVDMEIKIGLLAGIIKGIYKVLSGQDTKFWHWVLTVILAVLAAEWISFLLTGTEFEHYVPQACAVTALFVEELIPIGRKLLVKFVSKKTDSL